MTLVQAIKAAVTLNNRQQYGEELTIYRYKDGRKGWSVADGRIQFGQDRCIIVRLKNQNKNELEWLIRHYYRNVEDAKYFKKSIDQNTSSL